MQYHWGYAFPHSRFAEKKRQNSGPIGRWNQNARAAPLLSHAPQRVT